MGLSQSHQVGRNWNVGMILHETDFEWKRPGKAKCPKRFLMNQIIAIKKRANSFFRCDDPNIATNYLTKYRNRLK